MRTEFGQFDVVIVGAGTAGCLLANRLSANPRTRVALIEAGGQDDYIWIHVPVGYLYCIGNPRTDWCFSTQAQAGLNGRVIGYPRGKVLGGCSSINGMIYMRGQREDYDGWRDGDGYGGNPGWGWKDVLPYFMQHEDHFGGADESHGAGQEWRVENARIRWKVLDAFRAASIEQGLPANDDFNCGDNLGCGYFHVNQKRGVRWNAAKAFLRPILNRSNLHVFTRTQVTRLNFEGRRCTGVDVLRDGVAATISARAEVLLAAGSVSSPHLMQLSGLGDPAKLDAVGVNTTHALRGVGENLQDHLQLRMAFKVSGVRTLNTLTANPFVKLGMGLQYALLRSGPMSMSPSQLGAFAKSDPSQPRANLEYHVQPLSLEKFGDPLHAFGAFTASVCDVQPASRGRIRLQSNDPFAAPLIDPNYLSAERDRKVAADAIRLTRRIVASRAMEKYHPQEFRPGIEFQTEEELEAAAGAIGTTIFHPVGTAKMGPAADPMAVVDADLRVHGLQGLRVIDASVMPTITSGNTNAPTLMVAEKGASLVLAALARGVESAEVT